MITEVLKWKPAVSGNVFDGGPDFDRNQIIKEVFISYCEMRENLGYKKLDAEDIRNIDKELEEKGVCLTPKERMFIGI